MRDVSYPLKWLAISIVRRLVHLVLKAAPKQPPARDPAIKSSYICPASSRKLDLHIYLPSQATEKQLPIYVSFHGAGFVLTGLLGEDAPFCSWLADEAQCVVVNANYAKGPEAPWPAGPDSVHAAVERVKALAAEYGWDASRIAIGGFSSGACLALVEASTNAQDLRAVVAFYPSTRLDQSPYEKPKVKKPAKGDAGSDVPAPIRRLFYSAYVPAATVKNRADPRISPLWAESAGFPSSVTIITAELDSLGAEGEELYKKLERDRPGIAKHWMAKGQSHAWDHSAKMGTRGDDMRWQAWRLCRDRIIEAFR